MQSPLRVFYREAQTRIFRTSAILSSGFLTAGKSARRGMASRKHGIAKRLEGSDRNVWVEFTALQRQTGALNLGQGFPEFLPPKYIRDALVTVASSEDKTINQYTRAFGHPRLVQALSDLFSPIIGQKIDPLEEVVVTVGAYGALYYCTQGLINPGDEVIIIEPFFDCYQPMVKNAGGIPVFVPLRPKYSSDKRSTKDWHLDLDELASKFNKNTKAIFFNNPNNPLGKVFSREEMTSIADLCKQHDVLVFADEVYEWIAYEENKTIKMASLPGMWERTISIGSAGKAFSVTGWKLGWAMGPRKLMHALQTAHQNCIYTCCSVTQAAVAAGLELEKSRLEHPDCYFNSLTAELLPKRDRLVALLEEVNMTPIVPQGGYFMMADFSNLDADYEDGSTDSKDYKFVRWLMKNKAIGTIPPSAFYGEQHKHLAENMVRICFAKEDSTLDKAADILREWKASK